VQTTRPGGPQLRGAVQEWHVLQRSLPVAPASVRLARMTARVACRAWRAPAAEEAAALVVSELVTVVVRHVAPPPGTHHRGAAHLLSVRVLMTPRRLRLEVHDPSGAVPPDVGATVDDARALAVVTGACVRWGVECRTPGAQLWAEIAV
jgi:hypothetical protein